MTQNFGPLVIEHQVIPLQVDEDLAVVESGVVSNLTVTYSIVVFFFSYMYVKARLIVKVLATSIN